MDDQRDSESAKTVLVAGTASHVGKSTVAAGLCRILADRNVAVAPYKAQNMSNNARAVPGRGESGGEIGVSQYVQARAARVPATVDMNPVLLKPRGEGESQVIVHGEAVGHYSAGSYYEDHWEAALAAARESYERLASDHDVLVAEGAGSIAEPNLRDRDLANVETARFSDAEILLVADIERGGVFASLVGTLELLPGDLREQVVGAVITKFRGDRAILRPGLEEFEDRTGVPVLGVVPHDDPGLPEEDSVSLPSEGKRALDGADDGVPDDQAVTIAVPRLPRISNFTDFGPLARVRGVRVAYVPLEDPLDADAVAIPGTKNTVDDLLALRESRMAERIRAFEGPIVGICGGYQMLGERITNAAVESASGADEVVGLGLLPVATHFDPEKRVEAVTREVDGVGPLAGAHGEVTGYEIHMGRTELVGDAARPFGGRGAGTERVLGTYLHGLFENETVRRAFVETVFDRASVGPQPDERAQPSPYDRAATLLEEFVDLDPLNLQTL
ncbi:cobyric acid synthase [Salinibaculum rarum]|uniref:cobyric acid synthase n=1 Tax=Salinibaculum rarum TaxID=3058903 RepID=UPI00265F3303|nr:cobyric acid synthase [Salinibaculum sp. KK48]